MGSSAIVWSPTRPQMVYLAAVIGALLCQFAVVLPARSGDFYDHYPSYGYRYAPEPYYHRGCWHCGCSGCGEHRRHVFERRVVVREYIERRYVQVHHHHHCYPCGYGIPRPYGGEYGPASFPYGYGGVRYLPPPDYENSEPPRHSYEYGGPPRYSYGYGELPRHSYEYRGPPPRSYGYAEPPRHAYGYGEPLRPLAPVGIPGDFLRGLAGIGGLRGLPGIGGLRGLPVIGGLGGLPAMGGLVGLPGIGGPFNFDASGRFGPAHFQFGVESP
jgi:hypothetical protein